MPSLRRWLTDYGRVLTGRKFAARALTVYPDDTFLVSFPRSGNTWTRFLVCNLINADNPVTFAGLESRIPEIYDVPDRVLRAFPRPRIVKSHECFDPRYKKVIYIVRDPRDVAVSNYHWELKLRSVKEGYPIEDFVPRWMAPEFWPRIGSWGDHVGSWLATRQGKEGFLLLRY